MLLSVYRNPRRSFTIFILLFSSIYWVFPDIMPFQQGFGFEGYTLYKPLAENLRQHLFAERMNSYSIQRIFPFLLLHLTFKLFGISFTDAHLILFFQVFHLFLALLVITVWHWLAQQLKLSLAGQWVGYLSLLVNFATLKHDFYIPFTYDRLAMTSGLLSLYFYYKRRPLGLAVNALFALAIWPTAVFFNLLLLLVPAGEQVPATSNPWLSRAWAIGLAGAVCGLFTFIIYVRRIPEPQNLAPLVRPLLPLGLALAGAYLAYTQASLVQRLLPGWLELRQRLVQLARPRRAWLYAATLVLAYYGLTRGLGDPNDPNLTPQKFALNLTYGALQRPGQFLICHAIYYGLPVLFIALFWQRTLRAVSLLGLGTGLMLVVVLAQALNNETRQLANVLPLLALLAAVVADGLKPQPAAVLAAAAVAFLLSKGWLPLHVFDPNYGQPNDIFPMTGYAQQGFLAWPQQAYFMNFGPWAATPYLAFQALVVVGAAWLLHQVWAHPANRPLPHVDKQHG